jgi:metal-responsive CopG/Arc/MetJ family transcriptional regulator
MKAIQITVDEALLCEIDKSPEARKEGRSAVFRRAAAAYLRQSRQTDIARRYAAAYAQEGSLGSEFAGWEEQGEWPAE